MKILNLYAGIGGNRNLWGENHQITAVEFDEEIAKAYKKRYPNDEIIIGDAKEYLLNNYQKFDFIWASPPCQTHARSRFCRVNNESEDKKHLKAVYPDMSLYQIIMFLKSHCKTKWIVENVIPYYKPIIKPSITIDRHFYWSNFNITKIEVKQKYKIEETRHTDLKDFDLKPFKIKRKDQVIRNQVNYEIGKHILECAEIKQPKQLGLFA